MQAVASFLDRFKTRKRQQTKSALQQYRDLQVRFLSGEEVDDFETEGLLELLGKSEADLERDIASLSERLELASQRDSLLSIQSTLPALESKHEAARQELAKVTEKLQKTIGETWSQMKLATDQLNALPTIESKLRSTCKDPDILEREAELQGRQREITRLENELDYRHGETIRLYEYHQMMVDNYQDRLNRATEKPKYAEIQQKLRESLKAVESRKNLVDQVRSQMESLKAEFRANQSKLESLHFEKLKP